MNEVNRDTSDATSEECVRYARDHDKENVTTEERPPMLWNQESRAFLAWRQANAASPKVMHRAYCISGQALQVELPEGIDANFFRGTLAEKLNSERFAEGPNALKVIPSQIRLYVDHSELPYAAPAPFEVSMMTDPPLITYPTDHGATELI